MAIATTNPATGEVLKTFEPLTASQIEAKLALATQTFSTFKKLPFAARGAMMSKAADILESEKEAVARLMTLEMGKTFKSAVDEAVKCAWACRYYAEKAEKFLADEIVDTGASKSYVHYQPMGVILAVMPWNFPFWQVFRFIAPSLMAGNVGLLKHASNVPQCALKIEEIMQRAGFPGRRVPDAADRRQTSRAAVARPARGGGHLNGKRRRWSASRRRRRQPHQESGAGAGRQRSLYRHAQRESGRRRGNGGESALRE